MRDKSENRGEPSLRAMRCVLGLLVATAMLGCGADAELPPPKAARDVAVEAAGAQKLLQAPASGRRSSALAAAPQASGPYGGVAAADAVAQLLDYAETTYPQYFPGHKVTQTFQQYSYRYYPETGRYVGVAVQLSNDKSTVEGGVYVLGGDFGVVPTYVGMLTSFITPYKVLHYTDKVYGLWTGTSPFSFNRTGAAKVKNMTQYQAAGDGFDIFACLISSHAIPDGRIPLLCKDGLKFKWHELYIDPVLDEVHEFVGTLPADLSYVLRDDGILISFGTGWKFNQDPDPLYPDWWVWAHTADGWYFTSWRFPSATVAFQDNAGNVSVIAQKTPPVGGDVRVMFSYSN